MTSNGISEQSSAAAGSTPAWVLEVTRVVEDLRLMNRSTEADFLAVGGKLMGFLSAARDIRTAIGVLAGCISGAGGEHACNALAAVLGRAKEMQKRAEEAAGVLDGLRCTAGRLRQEFSRFDDVVLSFRVVATLGRIEASRLGAAQSNLGHLAGEVGSCTEEIRKSVSNALQEADRLGRHIDLSIRQISLLDVEQLAALPALIDSVETSLEAFRRRQFDANETTANLDEKFRYFSDAINEVVTAVQFHDITRQQIEHVVESLSLLPGDRDSCGPAAGPSPDDLAIMSLQRHQLMAAAAAFGASVDRVKCQLEQIAAHGREMAGEAELLLGLTGGNQGSFFDRMERCFGGVLAAISNCTALNEGTAQAAAELQRTIPGLQASIADIRAISSTISCLALNLTIEALHLGAGGEPLNVVAGGMRDLRANIERRSGETEESLAVLMGEVQSMAAPHSGDAAVGDELRTAVDELHASSERSLACSRQISHAAAGLCADVQSVSDGFVVGKLFDEAVDRCCGVLERIGAEYGVEGAGPAGGLDHLAARYTMQSERGVHEMAMAAVAPPGMDVPAATDGFGDNVELF